MSDIFDFAKKLSGEEKVEQVTSTLEQIPAFFLTFMAILVFFFYYRYISEPREKINPDDDTPDIGRMTAQEYNKKADAQMEAIRSERSITPDDPSDIGLMTAQEYNKKADAQMEAIRSGRSNYEEPSAKSVTETKGIPDGWTGRLSGFMGAIGLVIGFVKQGSTFSEKLLSAVSFGLMFTAITAAITYISVMIFNTALKASNAKQNTFLQGVVFAWVVMGSLVALDFAMFGGTFFIALIMGEGF